MKIACIGWGSLVWNQGDLPIQGMWLNDGPFLPIEFARQSQDNRITLVCVPRMPLVQSLWARLISTDLSEACEALRKREGISLKRVNQDIGIWVRHQSIQNNEITILIDSWGAELDLDAAIWTNLPAKFRGVNRVPSAEEVVSHLSNLTNQTRQTAEQYVRMAPRQIRTNYRKHIENELNWFPDERAF